MQLLRAECEQQTFSTSSWLGSGGHHTINLTNTADPDVQPGPTAAPSPAASCGECAVPGGATATTTSSFTAAADDLRLEYGVTAKYLVWESCQIRGAYRCLLYLSLSHTVSHSVLLSRRVLPYVTSCVSGSVLLSLVCFVVSHLLDFRRFEYNATRDCGCLPRLGSFKLDPVVVSPHHCTDSPECSWRYSEQWHSLRDRSIPPYE